MQITKHRSYILGLLLAASLALTIVPAFSAPASEAAPVFEVFVNGDSAEYILSVKYPYLLKDTGKHSATGTLGGDAVAHFDVETGTLTLQGYNLGHISVSIMQTDRILTIKLIGTNSITAPYADILGIFNNGNIIITSDDPSNSLTVRALAPDMIPMRGIRSFYGDIIVSGKANVAAYAVNTTASPAVTNGLWANNIRVLDEASLTAVAASSHAPDSIYYRYATYAAVANNIFINTTGTVTLDTSANKWNSYAFSGNITLTKAAKLTLKWKGYDESYDKEHSITYNPALFTHEIGLFAETYTYKGPLIPNGSANRTSDTSATIGFTTSKAGTGYCLVNESGAAAPTGAKVKLDGTSLGAVSSGSNTGKVVTLTAGAKDIYVVVEDQAGNVSSPLRISVAAYAATDTTPPALSNGSVSRTSDTAATIGFTTDEAGTAYYLVLASGAAAPSKAAVKAGTLIGAVTAGTNIGKAVTLTAGAKDVYIVVVDQAGNVSSPLKISVAAYAATDTAPPALSNGSVSRTSDTAATIGFTTDEAGTAYYLVLASGAAAPSKAAVKAGTLIGAVTAGTNIGKAVTLTAGAKDVYIVVVDQAGNVSSPLKIHVAAWENGSVGGDGDSSDGSSGGSMVIVAAVVLALAVMSFFAYWFFIRAKP